MAVKCIAIGNRMMGDDAVGIKVLEELSVQLKLKNIEVIIGETDTDYALNKIEEGDLVFVFDSTYFDITPGTVTFISIDDFKIQHQQVYSQHQPNLISLLKYHKKSVKGYLIGIEINEIYFSLELSDVLKKRFRDICIEASAYIYSHYMYDYG